METVSELVCKAQSGDRKAFEQLVLKYQPRLYTLSYKLAGNYTDAQDLAQEAFIKAYKGLGNFRGEAEFGTWLYRIAVNIWLNEKRRREKNVTYSLDEPLMTADGEITREIPDSTGDPLEILQTKEFRGLVASALNEITKEHKTVLVLREIEGFSYDEIAAIIECSIGTVRSRLNRAREALRKKIEVLAREKGINVPGSRTAAKITQLNTG